jgi:crossover junction endodeoxyribonuclease RuvC
MGLDISSSNTGWCIVDVEKEMKLVEYGLISPVGNMGVTQRLYFFGNELKKLIEKFQPNEIAVEETILVRGPKVMRTLSRFSGVALFLAYSYQKREIQTYEPPKWKKNLSLSGFAEKAEIQLKVCEAFKLLDEQKAKIYFDLLKQIRIDKKDIQQTTSKELKTLENEFRSFEKKVLLTKKELKHKKKKEITEQDTKNVEDLEQQLVVKKDELKNKKKQCSDSLKDIEKRYGRISVDIYSDTGISNDIADSIGVSLNAINDDKKL